MGLSQIQVGLDEVVQAGLSFFTSLQTGPKLQEETLGRLVCHAVSQERNHPLPVICVSHAFGNFVHFAHWHDTQGARYE